MSQTQTHNFSLQLTETKPTEKMNKKYSVFMIPVPPASYVDAQTCPIESVQCWSLDQYKWKWLHEKGPI